MSAALDGSPGTNGADVLKEEAKRLFTKGELGTYWNDLYKSVDNCRDFHFVQRLNIVSQIVGERFPRDSKVLDLGCGAGVLSERLLDQGFSVEAADISADMLEFTRARLARFDASRYRTTQAEVADLPFADDMFDLIACIGVFGYMDDVDSAVAEVRRVLKPGGTLIMSVRNFNQLVAADCFNWMKAPLVAVPKLVLRKVAEAVRTARGGDGAPAKNKIEIFDTPDNVRRIFESFGFVLTDFDGAGYGPPTFRGKQIVSEERAKQISAVVDRAIRTIGIENRAKWLADISVYVFEKR